MSERKPTAEQQRAIDTLDENVFVTAGAGTGKTFVLTEHYMQILRRRAAGVSDIAAVTFTDKAAREMRERIRDLCRAEEERGEQPDFWSGVMHALDGARIGTIHGMCSAILREYPLQAGCDPAFGVLDESAATLLRAEAVEAAVEALLERDDADFTAVVEEYGLHGVTEMLVELIKDAEKFARAAEIMASHDDEALAALWRERFHLWRDSVLRELSRADEIEDDLALLRENPADKPDDKLEGHRRTIVETIDEMRRDVGMDRRFHLVEQICGIEARGGSIKSWSKPEMLQRVRDAVKVVLKHFKKTAALLQKAEDDPERTAALARSVWRVGAFALEAFSALKAARGVLDFDDLQIKTRDLLRRDPAMRAALRERTRFVLVDEFQDINPIQKEIVFMLAGLGEYADGAPAHLMVVGDAKQSIYRFRGADVTVFNNLRDELEGGDACVLSIDRNFRTVRDGVALFNILFERIMPRLDDLAPYCAVGETAVAHRPAAPGGVCAEIHVALFDPAGKPGVDARRNYEAEMVAHRIREMVENEGRDYGDIAILFRAMKGRCKIFERALREYGIPYQISAGSGFYGCDEIAEPISALRFLENPRDDYALLAVLRSTMMGLDDNALFWIARSEGECLWEKLRDFDVPGRLSDEQARCLARAREILGGLLADVDALDLPGILRRLLAETDYEAVLLASFMGAQKAANARKLLELARSVPGGFDRSGGATVGDFVDYVDDLVENETRESQAVAVGGRDDVVRLMTVHKSKGLEFPVVILPDTGPPDTGGRQRPACIADEELGIVIAPPGQGDEQTDEQDGDGKKKDKPDGMARIVWKEENGLRDAAEEKRIFYVATTRARERLIITATLLDGKEEKRTFADSPLGMALGALDMDVARHSDDATLRADANGVAPVVRVNVFAAADAVFTPPEGVRRTREKPLAEIVAEAGAPGDYPLLEPIAPDTRRKTRFTPSELATCDYCARKFYLQSILGLEERRGEALARAARGDPPGIPANVFGTMAHEVFESLDPASGELPDRAKIADFIAARHALDADKIGAAADKIADFVAAFATTPLFAEIAAAKEARRELPFLLRLSDGFVQGTIDLLFERADGTPCVVDYKSDRVGDEGMAAHAANYRAQMAAYAEAARVASGRENVSAMLYFMRVGGVFAVKPQPELLDNIVGRIREGRFERREGRAECRCGYGDICRKDIAGKGAQ